jgi:hypothetical protein
VTVPADPEFLLAAACCRWPPSPARDAEVQRAAADVDWARFGQVVQRQRIAGLVDLALKTAGIAVPVAIAAMIGQQAKRIAFHNLFAAAETARVMRLIEAAGYPVLTVKGVALGARAYGSIALKHSKDIDLLILPEHVGPVLALLEADSYRLVAPAATLSAAQRALLPRYGKDATLARVNHAMQIELHWRLIGNTTMLPGVTARAPADPVGLGGDMVVPTLNAPDLYAYLVVHGAIDGWHRMKWIADVNAWLAPLRAEQIVVLHDHAVTLGAEKASAQALILMEELFGLPLPRDFAQSLRRLPGVHLLVAGSYRLIAVRDGVTEVFDWRGGRILSLALQTLLGRGLRYHWQTLKSVLYVQADMYQSKIPPPLYRLYPAIRVPVWLAERIGGISTRLIGTHKGKASGTKAP